MYWYSEGEMGTPDAFEAMADACIATHKEILEQGSPEMQTASRMLLLALADEIRRRASDQSQAENNN